jgi:hypothetical protein
MSDKLHASVALPPAMEVYLDGPQILSECVSEISAWSWKKSKPYSTALSNCILNQLFLFSGEGQIQKIQGPIIGDSNDTSRFEIGLKHSTAGNMRMYPKVSGLSR